MRKKQGPHYVRLTSDAEMRSHRGKPEWVELD